LSFGGTIKVNKSITMQVITNSEGSVTILKPLGPLVMGELEEIDQALRKLGQQWTKRMVLNMANSTFIDSAGLELLNRYHFEYGEHGLKLKLSGLNDICNKIFELTKMAGKFEIYSYL